ncbi:MAG: Cell morphogenesis protein PAG1 [Alyxoria varia]|nr:MAG: Cell morphogenesis protein PAG1 [Alyxoria varia]
MAALDYNPSFDAPRRAEHDLNTFREQATTRRGRGLSASSNPSLQRQKSLQTISRTLTSPENLNGALPRSIMEKPYLNRSPSSSQPHSRQPSVPPLTRTQSNVSNSAMFTSVASHSPSRTHVGVSNLPNNRSRSSSRAGLPGHHYGAMDGTRVDAGATAQRKAEKMRSDRTQRELVSPPHRSRSTFRPEIESVGGFTLEHLLQSFFHQADIKVERCASNTLVIDPDFEESFGRGADPNFDQILNALAHVARMRPRPLIERLIKWKTKHDDSAMAGASVGASPGGVSQQTPSSNQPQDRSHRPKQSQAMPVNSVRSERISSAASYLLYRALIEIANHTNLSSLSAGTTSKLESIAFDGTVNNREFDQSALLRSSMRFSKWNKASELLGVLSQLDFGGVSTRYLQQLKECQKHLSVKGNSNIEIEAKASVMLKGMRQLRPSAEPETAWIQSCSCMQTIAEQFDTTHGHDSKIDYCRLLEALLLRLASSTGVPVNDQRWRKTVLRLNERLTQLASKPKYWHVAYPAQSALCCVSPHDVFTARWNQTASTISGKLREAKNRSTYLKALCRLTWRFTRRPHENDATANRHLEEIIRNVFFTGKKYAMSREPAITEPLIQLIRIIGHTDPDYCFDKIIFPLINSDTLLSSREIKVDYLDPDRIIIGIRAFLAIINDVEQDQGPPFPTAFADETLDDGTSFLASPESAKPRGRPRKHSAVKDARLSQPVVLAGFSEPMKGHYKKFCSVLGKITRICDAAFGGQAVLDERFSSSSTPKTPLPNPWTLTRRDDVIHYDEDRHAFYDLLHVAVQALPRCISRDTPISELVNLLCTGTSHVEKDIAQSSAASLKSIARQGYAQYIVARFSGFIMKYDDRYATMSDGGLLGADHIENTLRLYLELLRVWIEELETKAREMGNYGTSSNGIPIPRYGQLDAPNSKNHVDRVESQGLFFLCSPSNRVRSFAVDVLRLVTYLDGALGERNDRIYETLVRPNAKITEDIGLTLSVRESAQLEKGTLNTQDGTTSLFVDLCRSGDSHDIVLWYKVFPCLVAAFNDACPLAVSQTRDDVCTRLAHMHFMNESISSEDRPRGIQSGSFEGASRSFSRTNVQATESNVEQWKLYLIFTCSTMTKAGPSPHDNGQDSNHVRNASKSSQSSDSINNAKELFAKVRPHLFSENSQVSAAAIAGLGSINPNLYETLLESLAQYAYERGDEIRNMSSTQARASPYRSNHPPLFRTELVHVYELTSRHLNRSSHQPTVWTLDHLSWYTKEIHRYFQQLEPKLDNCELRRHFCGLLERFFEGVNKTNDPLRWMPFQTRKAIFVLLEDWYNSSEVQDKDSFRGHTEASSNGGGRQDRIVAVAENKKLQAAAASAMATLCAGPISSVSAGGHTQFSVPRILVWIDVLFKRDGDKPQEIGKRALKNLIVHNREVPELLENTVDKLYAQEEANTGEVQKSHENAKPLDYTKTLNSYLCSLDEIFELVDFTSIRTWKILGALLYNLGHPESSIRTKSASLLKGLEKSLGHDSKIQDFDISISDKTRIVNKHAQYTISQKLLEYHGSHATLLFSEFSKHFCELKPDSQRNMVSVLLPWMKTIELQLDPNGGVTASSYMVLLNLLQMTVQSSSYLHNEIQALWQALTIGPHPGNVRLILDFVVGLTLDRKDINFLPIARQIVVYLSTTEAGKGVIDFFLQQIDPSAMLTDKNRTFQQPPSELVGLPYIADITRVFPNTPNQVSLSRGQLSLILLVDLVVSGVKLATDKLPSLLHAVLVLWDHHVPTVSEQAREMLIHLVHVLVISKVERSAVHTREPSVEYLVDLIRRHDSKVVWNYGDNIDKLSPYELPASMQYVIRETVSLFSLTVPAIEEKWGAMSLKWAVTCPVRHQACRSLQVFRCLSKPFDEKNLYEMIARLACVASDDEPTMQTYAIELIKVLRAMVLSKNFSPTTWGPPVFWAVYAGLESCNEWEYREFLVILDVLLDKSDLSKPSNIDSLLRARPANWCLPQQGLVHLVARGCRSNASYEMCMKMLRRIVSIPPNSVITGEGHLLVVSLAHLPKMMHSYDETVTRSSCMDISAVLRVQLEASGHIGMSQAIDDYMRGRLRSKDDLFDRFVASIQSLISPDLEITSVSFLMSLLFHPQPWMKTEVLRLLQSILPKMDMGSPDFVRQGADIMFPLLRLLQTDYCFYALEVLENAHPLTNLPMDERHLKMSMVDVNCSGKDRDEFDDVRSMYGIPVSSGWSSSRPAERKQAVKDSITYVQYMFADSNTMDLVQQPTPPDFSKDENLLGSYFPDQSNQNSLEEGSASEIHIGQVRSELLSLDDFFSDTDVEDGGGGMPSTNSAASPALGNLRKENASSNVAAPPSTPHARATRPAPRSTNGDSFAMPVERPPRRDPGIMSPSAFASAASARPPRRPSLGVRSTTSPAVNQTTRSEQRLVPPAAEPEPLSDDDVTIGRTGSGNEKSHTGDSFSTTLPISNGTQITSQPLHSSSNGVNSVGGQTKPRFGLRGSIKRLASSSGSSGSSVLDRHRRATTKGQTEASPEVPKVPDEYLRNIPPPQSSDL